MLRILVDGSADMPDGWAELYQLDILPMPIQIGDKTYYQGEDLSPEKFYELISQGDNFPKSAAPSPYRIKDYIEKIYDIGDSVLSLNVSGKMSSTISMVHYAAKELKEKIKVYPFDSQAGSAVLAFMAREARLRERAGETFEEIQSALESMREKVLVVLTLDSLEFAYRSGRVGALTVLLSSVLKIKPIVTLQERLLEVSDKVRTRKKSLESLVLKVKEKFGSAPIKVAIVHSQDFESASQLKEMVERTLNVAETVFTELSIAVAANLGPKTVGIVALPDNI
jgi:DegV family protein with EDD domain